MTTNHIDQLAQWYADAEQITKANLPRAGDTLILPYNAGGYGVEVEEDGWTPDDVVRGEPTRVLSRAPKPKPAWHDARAIIAHTGENPRPSVWTWHKSMERWDDEGGCHWAYTEDLRDVTPLIEAKVADEMVKRARAQSMKWEFGGISENAARAILTAALGLETA